MIEKWYAVYTRPRWEKKVAELLTEKQVKNYCPLNRMIKQWSDRKKVVYEPLFTSYVFVRITEAEITALRDVIGIINFVYWLGKPAVIRDAEIEIIREFLHEHSNVHIEKPNVRIDDAIKVTSGPLMNREGVIVVVKHNTVKVELRSLGCIMYAELDKANVELVRSLSTEKKSVVEYAGQ